MEATIDRSLLSLYEGLFTRMRVFVGFYILFIYDSKIYEKRVFS